jgi:hypothetical protein
MGRYRRGVLITREIETPYTAPTGVNKYRDSQKKSQTNTFELLQSFKARSEI